MNAWSYVAARLEHQVVRFHFIVTELDLAITFSDIALTAATDKKAQRNTGHARLAYDSAMRFLEGAQMTTKMRQSIDERVKRVEQMLRKLDRRSGKAAEGS